MKPGVEEGHWTWRECNASSNWRQLGAVVRALSMFQNKVRVITCRSFLDNATTVEYINKQKGTQEFFPTVRGQGYSELCIDETDFFWAVYFKGTQN